MQKVSNRALSLWVTSVALSALLVCGLSACASGSSVAAPPATNTAMPTSITAPSATPTESGPVSGAHAVSSLNAVAMVSAYDGWAVGDGVLHYDGAQWRQVSIPAGHLLHAVSMVSATNGWAVGDALLRYDGHAWVVFACPVTCTMTSIVMISATDGWAVGRHYDPGVKNDVPLLLHFDGTTWSEAPLPPHALALNGLSLDSAGGLWTVGLGSNSFNDPDSWRFDRTAWTEIALPVDAGPMQSISMVSPSDGWCLGGGLLHYDGQVWQETQNPAGMYGSLKYVDMVSSAAGWAVSDHEILRYVGGAWTIQAREDDLRSLTMLSLSDGWAVGSAFQYTSSTPGYKPVIFHYDGSTWSAFTVAA